MKKGLLFSVFALFTLSFLGGCDLIWEPPEDAIDRFVEATASRDWTHVDEMTEEAPPELKGEVRALAALLNTDHYRKKTKYWRVVELEEDEATGYTYAYVEIDFETKSRTRQFEIIFEMERDIINWKILDIIDLDLFLSDVERLSGRKR